MRSPFYEQALAGEGVGFDYSPALSLSEIDGNKSMRNQARLLLPLDDELVKRYAAAMKAGSQFPPIVAYRSGKGRYVLIDGNQRHAAAMKAGLETLDAYIVNITDPLIIDRLTWTFNNLVNGQRLSSAECVEHAVTYVRKYNVDAKQAAAQWQVSLWRVRDRIGALKVSECLDRLGIKKGPALGQESLTNLAPLLAMGEDLLARAATLARDGGLDCRAVKGLVEQVKKAPAQGDKAKVLDDLAASDRFAIRKAETKGGTIKARTPSVRDRLRRQVRDVRNTLTNFDKDALKPAPADYRDDRAVALEVIQALSALFGFGAAVQEGVA
jgi:hypothetical protein